MNDAQQEILKRLNICAEKFNFKEAYKVLQGKLLTMQYANDADKTSSLLKRFLDIMTENNCHMDPPRPGGPPRRVRIGSASAELDMDGVLRHGKFDPEQLRQIYEINQGIHEFPDPDRTRWLEVFKTFLRVGEAGSTVLFLNHVDNAVMHPKKLKRNLDIVTQLAGPRQGRLSDEQLEGPKCQACVVQ